MGKKWLSVLRMLRSDIILGILVLFIMFPGGAALAANMQLKGHCYATISKEDGSGVTDVVAKLNMAFEADSSLKAKAAKDREFVNFFNEEVFNSAVK